jgi:hypothetical protein
MKVEIKKNASKKEVEKVLKKLSEKKNGNLKKYFGLNKNNVDGLAFQKKVRAEWD